MADDEKERIYLVLHNGLDNVVEELDRFCRGEYGRECSLYRAYVTEKDPVSYPAHGGEEVGAEIISSLKTHLREDGDILTFRFENEENTFLIRVVPGGRASEVVDAEEGALERVDHNDTVVMVEGENLPPVALELVEHL